MESPQVSELKVKPWKNLIVSEFDIFLERAFAKMEDLFKTLSLKVNDQGRIEFQMINDPFMEYIHANPKNDRFCAFCHYIVFERLNMLPYRCLNCYKTLGRPADLHELQEAIDCLDGIGYEWKYGLDRRDCTEGHLLYVVYHDTPEEAKKNEDFLINSGLPMENVKVQRGCSEFNQKWPDSRSWTLTDREVEYQQRLEEYFEPINNKPQPEVVQRRIKVRILRWCMSVGDLSYRDLCEIPLLREITEY